MKTPRRFTQAAMLLGALAAASAAAQAADVIEGRLIQATNTELVMEGDAAEQTFKFDPLVAQCYDFRNNPMTCATLVGVGYADKVRLTVANNFVQRVDILKLQQ